MDLRPRPALQDDPEAVPAEHASGRILDVHERHVAGALVAVKGRGRAQREPLSPVAQDRPAVRISDHPQVQFTGELAADRADGRCRLIHAWYRLPEAPSAVRDAGGRHEVTRS